MPTPSIFRQDLFQGQVILITGGGTGIGRATARELASLGATVVLASRDPRHLDEARAALVAEGGTIHTHRVNIRDPESVQALYAAVMEQCGRLDGLVNNGGGQFLSPAADIAPKGLHAVVETNLYGTFYMAQGAFRHWMQAHGGSIVNVVMENSRGFPLMAHSAAARAGVVNLTQTLALEWAQYGIRVNSVAPGLIASSGLGRYPDAVRDLFPQMAREIPAGRMGTETEVASTIVFLLSPAAAYISGTTLRVDGGSALYRHLLYEIPEHAGWAVWGEGEPDAAD